MTNTTQTPDYRQANALNIAVAHLARRDERRVSARQIAGRLTWFVKSQTQADVTYTITRMVDGWESDTCSCQDAAYRHAKCKHQKAIDLIAPAPAPAAEFAPAGGWLSTNVKKQRHQVQEEI